MRAILLAMGPPRIQIVRGTHSIPGDRTMQTMTTTQDQFKIALAYFAKVQLEKLAAEKKTVSPYVRRAFLRAHGGK